MQGRMLERTLYPRVENFLRNKLDCYQTDKTKGSEDVGQVDVIGVRTFRDRYSNRYEVIGVEVKPKTYHFGKKIGQTIGYSLLCHRVYLACKEEFTLPQIELASRLGIGLIQIKSKAGCSEIIGSDIFQPDKEKMLRLLNKMKLHECLFCRSVFDDKSSRNLPKAITEEIAYLFERNIERGQSLYSKSKKNKIRQCLYICPQCIKLFKEKQKS